MRLLTQFVRHTVTIRNVVLMIPLEDYVKLSPDLYMCRVWVNPFFGFVKRVKLVTVVFRNFFRISFFRKEGLPSPVVDFRFFFEYQNTSFGKGNRAIMRSMRFMNEICWFDCVGGNIFYCLGDPLIVLLMRVPETVVHYSEPPECILSAWSVEKV